MILPHRAYPPLAGADAAVLVAEAALHILRILLEPLPELGLSNVLFGILHRILHVVSPYNLLEYMALPDVILIRPAPAIPQLSFKLVVQTDLIEARHNMSGHNRDERGF